VILLILQFIAVIVLGYLIGAIPFGVIISRLTQGIDVRDYGSGSMGMTNVLRTVGTRAGVIVFLADLAKGAAAVGIAWLIFTSAPDMAAWGRVAGGSAAVIGHSWPVYIGFRGGRGVTTGSHRQDAFGRGTGGQSSEFVRRIERLGSVLQIE